MSCEMTADEAADLQEIRDREHVEAMAVKVGARIEYDPALEAWQGETDPTLTPKRVHVAGLWTPESYHVIMHELGHAATLGHDQTPPFLLPLKEVARLEAKATLWAIENSRRPYGPVEKLDAAQAWASYVIEDSFVGWRWLDMSSVEEARRLKSLLGDFPLVDWGIRLEETENPNAWLGRVTWQAWKAV